MKCPVPFLHLNAVVSEWNALSPVGILHLLFVQRSVQKAYSGEASSVSDSFLFQALLLILEQ